MIAREQRRPRNDAGAEEKARSQEELDTAALMDQFCRALVKAVKEEGGGLSTSRAEEEPGTREWVYSIDLMEFLFRLLVNLKYILLAAVLCATIAGFYTSWFVAPIYSARAKLYVLNQDENAIKLSDLQIGSSLTMDYQEVFRTWEVHELVRAKLGLNYSYARLQSMVSVSNPTSTRVLYITVRSADPEEAAAVANAYAEAAKTFILETMKTEEPSFFSVALVPSGPISPNPFQNIINGFLLGACLAIGIIFIRLLIDDKPRTPEDITRCAGIPTLAVVPGVNKRSAASHRPQRAKG